MKPPLVQLDAVGAAVDLSAPGVGPAVAVVEALSTLIAVEDPQTGGGEAASTETVERGGVQLSSDAAPPAVGIEVERVQVASVGSARSMGSKGAPTAAKPTTACAAVATTTLAWGSNAESVSDQNRSRSATDRPARTSSGIRPR